MNATNRMTLIRGHLEAVSRGRAPSAESIGVWLRELEPVADAELDDCIREARAHHVEACDRGRRWGRITPDDVLAVWRSRSVSRAKQTGDDKAPENPACPVSCQRGQVRLIGADGYPFLTRCSCLSGDWWASRSSIWRAMSPAGEYLENPAFKLADEPRPPMKESHSNWLRDRAESVGMAQAIAEYNAHVENAKRKTGG